MLFVGEFYIPPDGLMEAWRSGAANHLKRLWIVCRRSVAGIVVCVFIDSHPIFGTKVQFFALARSRATGLSKNFTFMKIAAGTQLRPFQIATIIHSPEKYIFQVLIDLGSRIDRSYLFKMEPRANVGTNHAWNEMMATARPRGVSKHAFETAHPSLNANNG